MKVICAGFPKTGTKSLAQALRILGYNKVYDFEESIEYGYDEWEEILIGKSTDINKVLDKVYLNGVEAVVDLPHSLFFEQFHRKWPEAKVILMIRDEDKQFESYKNMIEEARSTYYWSTHLLPLIFRTFRRWKIWSDCLLYAVVGWEPLCKYLGKPVPQEEFPYENKAGSDDRIIAKVLRDSRIVRDLKNELMAILMIFPIFICVLLWIFWF